MRTLIDLPEDDMKWLSAKAAEQGKSRAALVREAVSTYRAQTKPEGDQSWIERGYGYWAGREDIGDGLAYQLAIREDRTPYEEI